MSKPSVPFVQQMEAVECGAASLTMVLAAFGHHAPLSEVRSACGVSRDGVSAKAIVKAARRYGLRPKAKRLEPADLVPLRGPAILHWEMNHFVVFVRSDGDSIWINDPAIGPRKVAAEDFDRSFTGICLQFEATDALKPRADTRPSLARYRGLLMQSREALISLFGLALLINLMGLVVPMTTQLVIDRVVGQHQAGWLPAVATGGMTFLLGMALIRWLRGRMLTRLQVFVDESVGGQLVAHTLRLPMRFFHQRHAADLASRVQSVSALRDILAGQGLAALVDIPLLLIYLAILVAYNPVLAGLAVLAAALYVGVFFSTRPARRHAAREQLARDVKQDVELNQALKGMLALKSAGREDTAYARWIQRFVPALDSRARRDELEGRASALLDLVRTLAPAVILVVGARFVVEGALGLGALMGFLLLLRAFFAPIESLIGTLIALQDAPVHFGRMDDVLAQEPEASGEAACPIATGDIEFEGVSFRYGPESPDVLHDLSFSIRRGQKVAFVGASGSGKSTIARLLLGFHGPTEGVIRLDGVDLTTLSLADVRRQVGTVLQEVSAFPGDLRDNISMFDSSIPEEDVVAAARVAQLHADVARLPAAYATVLSAEGAPLSGGQLQRLALARAVVHRPPILVLDEATSALDSVTEAAVEGYLRERQCTRIVIAHRLSTVRDADRIMVVDGGRIAEAGTHEELVARGELYAELVASSSKSADAPEVADGAGGGFDPLKWDALVPVAEALEHAPAGLVRRQHFEAGAAIVQQGERTPGLFLVEAGEAELVLEEPGLDAYPLAPLAAGEIVGVPSLLDGLASPASAIARTAVDAWVLPADQFDALRNLGDPLALELSLALGADLAKGIRFLTERRREVGHGGGFEHEFIHTQELFRELEVGATALGASLTPDELGLLHRIGETRAYARDEMLFRQGDHAEGTMLVLSGRIGVVLEGVEGYMNVVRPGEIVGEVGLFGARTRSAGCVAIDPVVVFAIDHDALRRLLRSGDELAWKVLRHLIHNLVGVYRTSARRLREAVAMVRRERSKGAADEDPQDTAPAPEQDQPGRVELESHTAAACLGVVLQSQGREVPLGVLVEASLEGNRVTAETLTEAAASFGLSVRRIQLPRGGLRAFDRHLMIEREPGHFTLVEPSSSAKARAFDPLSGWTTTRLVDLTPGDEHAVFEITTDRAAGGLATRAWGAIASRSRPVAIVVGATAILQASVFAVPIGLSWLVEHAIPHSDLALTDMIGLGMLVAVIASTWLQWFRSRALTYLRSHIDVDLASQLMRHTLRLPIAYFERYPSGDILERFAGFAMIRSLVGSRGVAVALDVPTLLLSLVVMWVLDPTMFVVVAAGTVAYVGVSVIAAARGLRLARQEVAASAASREKMLAMFRGVATLRTSGGTEGVLRRWLQTYHQLLRTVSAQGQLRAAQGAGASFVTAATVLALVVFGAHRHAQGALGVADMLVFVSLAGYYFRPLQQLGSLATDLARAGRRIQLVRELINEQPEQSGAKNRPGRLRGRVTVEHVDFRYTPDGPLVLKDVSLEVPVGAKVALVGASGSGKSTLGRLLLGLYPPSSGRVLFDGRDLASTDLRSIRRQVGVVLQNPFIFSGSIRQNIAIGAAQVELSRVEAAADLAAVKTLIDGMPMRYETLLTEGGTTLSGGQRQRIALARALVGQPAVLLLDEATSAIDNVAQATIEDNLRGLQGTRVVIAHRLSTVLDADLVVVLDHGRIVEQGTYQELLQARGAFHRLAGNQLA